MGAMISRRASKSSVHLIRILGARYRNVALDHDIQRGAAILARRARVIPAPPNGFFEHSPAIRVGTGLIHRTIGEISHAVYAITYSFLSDERTRLTGIMERYGKNATMVGE